MRFHLRFIFILSVLLFCFGSLAYRILDLAYFSQGYYKVFINAARTAKEVKGAIRGQIRDRKDAVLATTAIKIDVGVDPYVIDPSKNQEKIAQLAALLGNTTEDMAAEFFKRETFVHAGKERRLRWRKMATIDNNDLYEKIKTLGIKGVYGNRRIERIYPNHELASHVIGFINKEGVAVCGVERFMDDFLRGQDGWIESEKDGKRTEVALFRKIVIEPKNGSNIVLTIDLRIQEIAEQTLQQAMDELKAKWGSIIISDPNTGQILALCNAPTFDCNAFNKVPIENLRNRAITDLYEPGSTFKIVPISIALQHKLISSSQYFDCTQETFHYQNKKYNLPKDHALLGRLTTVDVLRKSSNRGAAQIGIILGAKNLYEGVRNFGFGEKTGYGFDGEASGLLSKPKYWDHLTITRLPIGHAISATPLQVHQAMGVIASGGYLLEPKIILRILDDKEEVIIEPEPHVIRKVLRRDIANNLREILHNPDSSSSVLNRVKLAYKTGTTQKLIDGTYSREHHIASCSGFFPAEDPQFLVTVVLDDPVPEHGGIAYGSRVAYPLFATIAKALISSYGLSQ
ncbi:MAG: penicillin-binding protein 2 [Puniceicoccales bacterium]|nr:penicillin-binding protein 2 [Puniceicoccales bacterium]